MIHIGTCGYSDYKPGENWKERYSSKIEAYADKYSLLELNRTFYSLPMEKTARRWREEAGENLRISAIVRRTKVPFEIFLDVLRREAFP